MKKSFYNMTSRERYELIRMYRHYHHLHVLPHFTELGPPDFYTFWDVKENKPAFEHPQYINKDINYIHDPDLKRCILLLNCVVFNSSIKLLHVFNKSKRVIMYKDTTVRNDIFRSFLALFLRDKVLDITRTDNTISSYDIHILCVLQLIYKNNIKVKGKKLSFVRRNNSRINYELLKNNGVYKLYDTTKSTKLKDYMSTHDLIDVFTYDTIEQESLIYITHINNGIEVEYSCDVDSIMKKLKIDYLMELYNGQCDTF